MLRVLGKYDQSGVATQAGMVGVEVVEHSYFIASFDLAKTQLALSHSVTRSDRREPDREETPLFPPIEYHSYPQ